jgi:hypothetical protein
MYGRKINALRPSQLLAWQALIDADDEIADHIETVAPDDLSRFGQRRLAAAKGFYGEKS